MTIELIEVTFERRTCVHHPFCISLDHSCCSAFQFLGFSIFLHVSFICQFSMEFSLYIHMMTTSTLTSIQDNGQLIFTNDVNYLPSLQDDGRLLYTNDVKYLDLSLPFFFSFWFARFKVLSEQMLLLNLSKCVFCNRSPTRWLQPLKEEHLYGDASTTFWPDYRIYTLNANSST